MILDSSALLAMLQGEPEADAFAAALAAAEQPRMSAVTKMETSMVQFSRRGQPGLHEFDRMILQSRIEVVPFDERQADIARAAFARYGKGRHPAALNFGDCCVYALAVATGEPLLFKGRDFGLTDVTPAG